MMPHRAFFAFPNFDPVLIHLGPVTIRWYGLAYARQHPTRLALLMRVCIHPLGCPLAGFICSSWNAVRGRETQSPATIACRIDEFCMFDPFSRCDQRHLVLRRYSIDRAKFAWEASSMKAKKL